MPMMMEPGNPSIQTDCAGLILSGGLSKRMGGRNKALVELAGRPLLAHVENALSGLFPELMLATRDPGAYAPWEGKLRIIEDIFKTQSPLAGIHSGLVHTAAEYIFCTACDTPLVRRRLVKRLLSEVGSGADVIVPWDGVHLQPLCAIYRNTCIPAIEAQLQSGDRKTDRFFSRMTVRKISYEELREADPELLSFFNVNCPEDLTFAESAFESFY